MDLMRISTCTYPMREKSVEYALRVVADAGFRKVDVWGRMPHFSLDPAELDMAKVAECAKGLGVQVANLGTYPGAGFATDDEAELAEALSEMKRTLDMASQLGCRSIRVQPGAGEDPSIIDKIVEPFKQSAAYAEAKGVYMGIENHKGAIAGDPQACLELAQKVGSKHFGILYEPCNLMHAGVCYKKAFETFKDWITHVHVKDGAVRDGKFARTMLGEGDVDVAWVVDSLERSGYAGDYALEYEICDLVPIETGLKQWFEYFVKL